MVGLMIFLCIVFFTVSVFLIAKFGIKQKDDFEFVSENKYNDEDNIRTKK